MIWGTLTSKNRYNILYVFTVHGYPHFLGSVLLTSNDLICVCARARAVKSMFKKTKPSKSQEGGTCNELVCSHGTWRNKVPRGRWHGLVHRWMVLPWINIKSMKEWQRKMMVWGLTSGLLMCHTGNLEAWVTFSVLWPSTGDGYLVWAGEHSIPCL